MIVKLLGYAPDADPTILGVLTNCANMVPSLKGMKGAPTPASAGITVFHSTCQGAAVVLKLDKTTRFFAGSSSVISELTDINTWTTRGSSYATVAETSRWRYAQYGDISLAASKENTIQASTTSAFAGVSGAPAAAIIDTVGQFVMALNTTDATYGDSPDRWWCSGLGNHATWTPSVSTQAATGRLTSSPGKLVAGRRFGESFVAFKTNSIYRADYVGVPAIWSWSQIPGDAGALCQEVVVDIGTPDSPRLIFMGQEDFYTFDGSRPIPIGDNRVKEAVYNGMARNFQEHCIAQHDRNNSLIYFYYPSAESPIPDKCVVYNYRMNRWGRADRQIEAAVEYITPGLTYEGVGGVYGTYGELPGSPYGEAFFSASAPVPAIFDTSHLVKTMNGATGSSSITTGDMGDDIEETTLQRVKCRYITSPTSASLINFYRQNIGDSLTTDATTAEAGGKFDFLRESRWHRLRLDFVGNVELSGLVPEFSRGGSE